MNNLYAQAAEEAAVQAGNPITMFLPFIMMFAVIYFLMIRPQQKQRKEHQKMLSNLKVNDKVVTTSGIIGKIMTIKEDKNIVVIRVDETSNTKIEFQKHTIASVLEKEENNA